MRDKASRTYDVVVWGATGFTGRLVAEYLLEAYGTDDSLRWAIAGRSRAKLEEVRRALGPRASRLDTLSADASDERSLEALAARTRVVCTTVGPYAEYGSRLVAACVRQGTDSCDLCGEPIWMQRMIDEHHDAARESGARIVNSCGFDSIPSDCGVAFLNDFTKRQTGLPCSRVALRVEHMRGGMSGGTIASLLGALAEVRRNPSSALAFADPYSLNPAEARSGPDGPDLERAAFDEDLGAWITPFIMASINTRIVRRTNALLGYPYGADFRYEEALLVGKGAWARLEAHAVSLGLAAFVRSATLAPGLARQLLPRPGQGPSRERRESGSFSMLLVGRKVDGGLVQARVSGKRDPGYGCTSRMLGESAVCLARDFPAEAPGGLLTPASAMQEQLLPRLREKAGLTLEILAAGREDTGPSWSTARP